TPAFRDRCWPKWRVSGVGPAPRRTAGSFSPLGIRRVRSRPAAYGRFGVDAARMPESRAISGMHLAAWQEAPDFHALSSAARVARVETPENRALVEATDGPRRAPGDRRALTRPALVFLALEHALLRMPHCGCPAGPAPLQPGQPNRHRSRCSPYPLA